MMVNKRGEYFSLLSCFVVILVYFTLQFPTVFATHSRDHHQSLSASSDTTIISSRHIQDQCVHKCPEQVKIIIYLKKKETFPTLNIFLRRNSSVARNLPRASIIECCCVCYWSERKYINESEIKIKSSYVCPL